MIRIKGMTSWSLTLIICFTITSLVHTLQNIITLFLSHMIRKGYDDCVAGRFGSVLHMFNYINWNDLSRTCFSFDIMNCHDNSLIIIKENH